MYKLRHFRCRIVIALPTVLLIIGLFWSWHWSWLLFVPMKELQNLANIQCRFPTPTPDTNTKRQTAKQETMIVAILSLLLPVFASAQTTGGGTVPFLNFAYEGYIEPSYFQFYEANLGSNYLKRCVKREQPPNDGDLCRKNPKACFWGEQICTDVGAGSTQPTTRCNCENESWSCFDFMCPTIADSTCPAEDPSTPSSMDAVEPICSDDMTCVYEEQTCCGLTFAKKQ